MQVCGKGKRQAHPVTSTARNQPVNQSIANKGERGERKERKRKEKRKRGTRKERQERTKKESVW